MKDLKKTNKQTKKTSKEQEDDSSIYFPSSIYFQEDSRLCPSPHPTMDPIYSALTICQHLLMASSL